MNPKFRRDDDLSVFNATRIQGAVADTEVKDSPGAIHGILIGTTGASSSMIHLYDGAVSGTAFAEIQGDVADPCFIGPLDVLCESSIHVKTVDSGGAMEVTVLWR